jgi:hypothetical protein
MLAVSPLREMLVLGSPNQEVKDLLHKLGARFYHPSVGFCR